jgi:hypothetical protein
MTIAEVTAQITGGDFDRNHTQRAKEHRMRVEANLEPEVLGVTTRAQVPKAGPSDQTDPSAPAPKKLPKRAPADDSEPNSRAIDDLASSVKALLNRPPTPVQVNVAPTPVMVTVEAPRPGKKVVTE